MPRTALTPQNLPADDGGLFGPTFTTVDSVNHHEVRYERGMLLLFRNPVGSTRTVTLKRLVRGQEISKALTLPAMSAASISGIGVIADLDLEHWQRSDAPGLIYFDVSASDFAVAVIRRKAGGA